MKKLLVTQTDRFLEPLSILKSTSRPKIGWIRYIRKSIGMTATQLAKRINVSRRRVAKIEESELQEVLTIKTLKTVASAMECQLVYAVIPKTTIIKTIEKQAKKIALKHLAEVSHHMTLENQAITDQKALNAQIEELVKQYLDKASKHLWDE